MRECSPQEKRMNLIFLDIDMTIWDETLRIPESTKDASIIFTNETLR